VKSHHFRTLPDLISLCSVVLWMRFHLFDLSMRCDFPLHIPLQVLTFVKLAKRRWFWKLGNKLIGGPCTLLYSPCWHFLVKLLTVVFAPVSSDDLVRMSSVEISHSYLMQTHTSSHSCHTDHVSYNRCSKCYFYMGDKR